MKQTDQNTEITTLLLSISTWVFLSLLKGDRETGPTGETESPYPRTREGLTIEEVREKAISSQLF